MSITEVLRKLNKYNPVLKEKYGVKRIGIFGSFVKGMQKEKSDIDVLVEFKKGAKTFDNYMDLKFVLENIFRKKVDLVIFEALKKEIRKQVLNEVKYAKGL